MGIKEGRGQRSTSDCKLTLPSMTLPPPRYAASFAGVPYPLANLAKLYYHAVAKRDRSNVLPMDIHSE